MLVNCFRTELGPSNDYSLKQYLYSILARLQVVNSCTLTSQNKGLKEPLHAIYFLSFLTDSETFHNKAVNQPFKVFLEMTADIY